MSSGVEGVKLIVCGTRQQEHGEHITSMLQAWKGRNVVLVFRRIREGVGSRGRKNGLNRNGQNS